MTSDAAPEVISPAAAEAEGLAKVLSFMKSHQTGNAASSETVLFLSGSDEGDRVGLTEQLHAILERVVRALSRGQSIHVLTHDQEISTQQAAEILGLSRPTVVKLIDDGELSAHVPGAVRRKLRLTDVLAYQEELRARRGQFITESCSEYDEDSNVLGDLFMQARRQK